jgi:hypothetical protein
LPDHQSLHHIPSQLSPDRLTRHGPHRQHRPERKALSVSEATPSVMSSLTTTVPEAFHKTNAFHSAAVPDTPLVRGWLARIYADEIKDSNCHVLAVIDDDPDNQKRQQQRTSPRSRNPTPPPHGSRRQNQFRHLDQTRHHAGPRKGEVRGHGCADGGFAGGGRSWAIVSCSSLFGVDDEAKGMGLGRKLLKRACEISD